MKILHFFGVLFLITQVSVAQVDTLFLCDPSDVLQLNAPANRAGYKWNPSSSLDNPTIHNPTAFPVHNTLYVAEIIDDLLEDNLIKNPDFELGNTGFESDYPYSERIFTQGLYGVTTSAKELNGIFFSDCPDHTSGDGLMMVVDGSPIEGEQVWCQVVEVKPNTKYAFSTWLASVLDGNPAELQFFINGAPLGFTFKAVEEVCQWRQFYQLWQSGDTTKAEICIINKNTDPNGNDFALDDFLFFEIKDIIYDSTMVIIKDVNIKASVLRSPDCGIANGEIIINPTGVSAQLSYSIDGSIFQNKATIEKVSAGTYDISVREQTSAISDFNTCIYDTTIIVSQNHCPIYIPNAIRRSSARNGLFKLAPHPDFVGTFLSLSIFDRWGGLVYQTNDHDTILAGWNGQTKAQTNLETGVYSYILKVSYPNGEIKQLTGDVTLF